MNTTEDIVLLTDHLHWLTRDQAWHYRILPKNTSFNEVLFYCEETSDLNALTSELEILLNLTVVLEPIPVHQVQKLLSTYYIKDSAAQGSARLQINNADNFPGTLSYRNIHNIHNANSANK